MDKRITIIDISKKLGVSTTTVTKALNGKPKVSEEVRKLIIKTADEMGYLPNKTAKALSRNELRIGIIFPNEPVEFYSSIKKGLEKGIKDLMDFKVTGIFQTVSVLNSVDEMKKALTELHKRKVDGIILSPGFDFTEYKDLVERIVADGIPVLYLVNDMFNVKGIGCVRMDGKVAGRMAAQFLSFCLGKQKNVAVLACNKEILIQKECIDGFIDEARKNELNIKGIYETQDDKKIAYYLTEKIIKEIPDLKGIYVSSFNSVAVCNCLEDYGKDNDIHVIGQDIYPELVMKLEKGSLKATLFQDPVEQGRKAVEQMYSHLTDGEMKNRDYLLTPQIVFTSNLESYRMKN